MATLESAAPVAHSDAIPAVVRRNTLLLALSQALTGAGTQLPYALGSLMSVALVGSLAWTGLAVSIMGASKFFVSYPLGRITDRYGRKPGFQLGLALSLVGTIGVGLAMQFHSPVAFAIALLVFGMGMSASLQLRVAAADMYPPSRRAEGIGWVLTGTMLGVFGAPILVIAAEYFGPGWGLEPLGLTWLLVPIVVLPCMLCIALVRPDPRDIALNLDKYYPGAEPAPRWDAAPRTSILAFMRHYPKCAAFLANVGGYGSMSIVMVLATLTLAHEGHGLAAISLSQSAHTTGMFGLSVPFGWLADRLGRRAVVVPGILTELLGVLLAVLTHDFWSITLGGFLVGAGWSAINVATTAMLADVSEPVERGQAVGANDTVGSVASVTVPLLVGPMTAFWGAASTSWLALALMVVPLVLFLRIREDRPGRYRYPGDHRSAPGADQTPAPACLAAARISRAIADRQGPDGAPLNGQVRRVTAGAADLSLAAGGGLSLRADGLPMVPDGVTVVLPPNAGLDSLGLAPGQPFALDRQGLWFPATGLRVDWQAAPRWEPRPRGGAGVTESLVADRVTRLRGQILKEAPAAGLATLLAHLPVLAGAPSLDGPDRGAVAAAWQLAQAAGRGETTRVGLAAARLEDQDHDSRREGERLLCGFLACWALASDALGLDPLVARRTTVAALAAVMPHAAEATRATLLHASRGEVDEAQGALLSALLASQAGPGAVDWLPTAALRAVLEPDPAGGAQWLAGVLLGASAALRSVEAAA